jgi:hypothetical protein
VRKAAVIEAECLIWREGDTMPRKTIPKNPGTFRVTTAKAGNYLVLNDRTGKHRVRIPCRDRDQAEELCRRLNAGDHNGEVFVPGKV